VPFQFHKDRIEDPKSRDAISIVCREVFGDCFAYECVVNGKMASKKKAEASVVLRKEPTKVKEKTKTRKNSSKDIEEIFKDM